MKYFEGYTKEEIIANMSKSFEFSYRDWGSDGLWIDVKKNEKDRVCVKISRTMVLFGSRESRDSEITLKGDKSDWTRIRAAVNRRLNKEKKARDEKERKHSKWFNEGLQLASDLSVYTELPIIVDKYGTVKVDDKVTVKRYMVKEGYVNFNGLKVRFENLETFVNSIEK